MIAVYPSELLSQAQAASGRPLISLVGIFKNEEVSIEAVTDSVARFVDHATLLDTGSTDRTKEIIRNQFAAWRTWPKTNGEPLLFEEPFVPFRPMLAATPSLHVIDFAATRNRVLELEEQREDAAVFTLMLSGDEELEGGEALRAFLETKRESGEDAYSIEMVDDEAHWASPRVLRVGSGRHYIYPIHEEVVGPNGERSGPTIPGVRIRYKKGDQARMLERFRTVDVPVLEYLASQPVTDDHETHLARARAILNLARTHENLATFYKKDDVAGPWLRHQMTAMALYMQRANLEGDPIDKGFALFRYYDIAWRVDLYTPAEMVPRLELLCGLDPRRPEIRYLLAAHAAAVDARKGEALAIDAAEVARKAKEELLPYVTSTKVEWMSFLLAAECAKGMKQDARARKMVDRAVAAGAPQSMIESVLG